ncbi:unnamed protein product, partial [marine sediment metagenome]
SVINVLQKVSISFDPSKKYRVRLLLKKSGQVTVASNTIDPPRKDPVKVAISDKRTNRNNTFFYHKTTNRDIYDSEFARYSEKGFFDVIFLNREGEVTEGAIANVIVKKDENYWTPPVSSGLLGGVYREHLLKSQTLPVKEKALYLEDLESADKVFLT